MLTTIIALGVAGLLLLFVEMFLPGIIAGVVGGCMLIAAVVLAYGDLGNEAGNLTLIISITSSTGLWWWWANHFQNTRFGKAMTLSATSEGSSPMAGLNHYTGSTGEATTPLRPSGTVTVQGKRMDAVTDGEFIEAGTTVLVVRAHGLGLLVRRA